MKAALQLLNVLEEWTEALDRALDIECIYLDFRKAFDTVPHHRLMKKLEAYGINKETLTWLEDFLVNRQQRVIINGETSKWGRVTSGIPQGSVLGPLLFVIYINDLPEMIKSTVYLFADDTKLFQIINSQESKKSIQEDLLQLTHWSEATQIQRGQVQVTTRRETHWREHWICA
ncbi:uncharacterized protein [Argopecten irradians]|uniref:uncharacterized protein n=1 Tax=Argopecten irradians TaxID=31199 RepID=UPI00372053C3